MPPKSRSGGGGGSGGEEGGGSRSAKRRRMLDKGSEEYMLRRERNNVAVKKSREKSRAKAKGTVEKVARLKEENTELEQQVMILSKELGVLKDLFKMVHAGTDEGETACELPAIGAEDPTTSENISADTRDVKPDVLFSGSAVTLPGVTVQSGDRKLNSGRNTIIVTGVSVNKDALQKDHEYVAIRR